LLVSSSFFFSFISHLLARLPPAMEQTETQPYGWLAVVFVVQLAFVNTFYYIGAEASGVASLAIAWSVFAIVGLVTIIILHGWTRVHQVSLQKHYETALIPIAVALQVAMGATFNYVAPPNTIQGLVLVWAAVAAAVIIYLLWSRICM